MLDMFYIGRMHPITLQIKVNLMFCVKINYDIKILYIGIERN